MKIKSLVRKGIDHKTYCEDYVYSYENKDWIIAAVFDGCSDGKDSHFASTLAGKCLNSIILRNSFNEKIGTYDVFEFLLFNFFSLIEEMRVKLNLTGIEMLSTMILLVYNKNNTEGKIIALGDGIISINGDLIIIDQNNEPEYPIVYAGSISGHRQDTADFISNHKNQWNFKGLNDVTISSDGLLQFKNKADAGKTFNEAIDFFINDTNLKDLDVMLARKYNIFMLNKWQNHDDLGIIRIINNEKQPQEEDNNQAVHSESHCL